MKRILFVDDGPLPRQVAQRFLKPYYEVEVAASGEEAFARLQSERFDLLITDIADTPASAGLLVPAPGQKSGPCRRT
ncbi:MAG: response regulator [Armatimonadetes bacterium]|nr:response regulator [Armatimonadota bacterium]